MAEREIHGEQAAADGATPFARTLVEQAMAGAWYRDDAGEPAPEAERRARAEAALGELAPRDGPERIAAAQTAACHLATMDALKWLSKPRLGDSARLQLLRVSAQLMTLSSRQLAGLDRHRAAVRAEAEALARARREARREARKERAALEAEETAPPGGVMIERFDEDPEVMARRWAAEVKANERRIEARLAGEAPAVQDAAGPARPPEQSAPPPTTVYRPEQAGGRPPRRAAPRGQRPGGGVLLVPERPSPEDWTRGLKAYYRALEVP